MDSIRKLQEWYAGQCDGEWEHNQGIRIETIDNPGWSVTIDVRGTPFFEVEFESTEIDRTETDWLRIRREGSSVVAFGGPCNLSEILEVFVGWAASSGGHRSG